MRKCPNHAIIVDRKRGEWKIDRASCLTCEGCVLTCPKKCLVLRRDISASAGIESVRPTSAGPVIVGDGRLGRTGAADASGY